MTEENKQAQVLKIEAEIAALEAEKTKKIAALKELKVDTKYTYVRGRPHCPYGACSRCWDYNGSKANYNLYNGSSLCMSCYEATEPWD